MTLTCICSIRKQSSCCLSNTVMFRNILTTHRWVFVCDLDNSHFSLQSKLLRFILAERWCFEYAIFMLVSMNLYHRIYIDFFSKIRTFVQSAVQWSHIFFGLQQTTFTGNSSCITFQKEITDPRRNTWHCYSFEYR